MDRSRYNRVLVGLLLAATVLPAGAGAQSISYGKTSSGPGEGAPAADAGGAADGSDAPAAVRSSGHRGRQGRGYISPYIEAAQVISGQLAPTHDVLTWSTLAVGVDGGVAGRNTQASFSVRYERRFGYGKSDSGDTVSGLARASVGIVPRTVTLEAGALATRTTTDGGAALPGSADPNTGTRLWSVYAGPSLSTHAGDVAVNGSYRVGYTEVGSGSTVSGTPLARNVDVFDHSLTQMATVHAGVAPGEPLPIGIGIGGGWYQEAISNLDQRVRDANVRADVAVPVSDTVSLVAGVGYEKVRVTSRDAVRDPLTGAPVIGADGRLITDKSSGRRIAYDTSGFTWDAGVTWRPSRRTAFEAHVGRRYGSTTYYGSFGWRASRRSQLNVSVYDSIAGFGGTLNRALAELPTDFEVSRNAVTGNINGCVSALGNSAQGSPCLTGALGGLRSATFRSRGIQASYAVTTGRLGMGLAAGYDRRKFIAAPGTVLATANGVTDENAWLSAWLNGEIDRNSSFGTFAYVDWFDSRLDGSDGTAIGANASYSRTLGHHLTGNAAISIQGIQRSQAVDTWDASAMLGLRYSFF
ncbi:MAG TPA: preprotein translocase subunit YajC [Novosphingobium sp.]|nr:preprotein translocase subunit YajC [Novosphingobium sp.]